MSKLFKFLTSTSVVQEAVLSDIGDFGGEIKNIFTKSASIPSQKESRDVFRGKKKTKPNQKSHKNWG